MAAAKALHVPWLQCLMSLCRYAKKPFQKRKIAQSTVTKQLDVHEKTASRRLLSREQASQAVERDALYDPVIVTKLHVHCTINRESFVSTKFRICHFRVQIFSDTSQPSEN